MAAPSAAIDASALTQTEGTGIWASFSNTALAEVFHTSLNGRLRSATMAGTIFGGRKEADGLSHAHRLAHSAESVNHPSVSVH
jgi:hypothetical protein